VSGYLMMNDRVQQDASHAWAEVYVDALGWVGFDASNAISPDSRYVAVATGLDYNDAAPISGLSFGPGAETLDVTVQVQQ
jgi:transglutaminase-like putative cysteine protease